MANGLQLPKKTNKITTSQENSHSENIVSNRFSQLVEENDMDIDGEEKDTSRSDSSQKKKVMKPPPINILKSSVNEIIKIITFLNVPKSAFLIKETDIGAHSVYINNINHYTIICTKFAEQKIQYYTYTPKHLKPKTILLKGIRGAFDAEDIKNEIEDLNIPGIKIISLTKFIFNKNQPDKHHFFIQLSSESKTADLFKIKAIAYQRIRWEHLRKPDLFQCKNCQRLGHASKNCCIPFRCVKCAQSHTLGECSIKAQEDRPALKSGHPASYKGCPFLKYALARKKEFRASKINSKLQSINKISQSVRENLSYAQAVNSSKPQPQPVNVATSQSSPPRGIPFPSSFSGSPTHHNINVNNASPPSWVSSLKEELAALVSRQFQTLASQIAANSTQIEFILNTIFNKDNA